MSGIFTTTAQSIQRRPVREYVGIVSSEVVATLDQHRDHGPTSPFDLEGARRRALRLLAQRAGEMGATVVVAVEVDEVAIGVDMVLVTATGTAVLL